MRVGRGFYDDSTTSLCSCGNLHKLFSFGGWCLAEWSVHSRYDTLFLKDCCICADTTPCICSHSYLSPARELFSLVAAKVVYGSLIVAFQFLAHLFIAQLNFLEIQINQLHPVRSHAIRREGESCCHNRFRISPLANNRARSLSRVSIATATAKPSVIFGGEEARYREE